MKNIFFSTALIISLIVLFSACKEEEEIRPPSIVIPESSVVEIDTDFSQAQLSDVRVSLREGALSFETVDDYRQAKRAILNSSPEQIDAWAASIGFNSWAKIERDIQARVDANPGINPDILLTEEENRHFYFDEEGWLHNGAFSSLMSELVDLNGILYIENDLNYFWGDRHVMIDEGTPDQLNQITGNKFVDMANGIYLSFMETQETDDGGFFEMCGNNALGFGTQGLTNFHRYQRGETLGDTNFRMVFELKAYSLVLSLREGREVVEFCITSEVQNRKKSERTWVSASVETEMGTLKTVGGQASSSGEVSEGTNDIWKSMRIKRTAYIFNFARSGLGPFLRIDSPGFPSTANSGGGLTRKVFSESRAMQLIDDKHVVLSMSGETEGWNWEYLYTLERGQLSANWLDISETMDIQIGCPD